MTTRFEDTDLMAYADGRADPALAGRIEAAMDSDAAVRREVLGYIRSTHMLRAAYQGIADEAPPAALVAAVRSAARRPRGVRTWQAPLRIAASLVLAVGVGAAAGIWGAGGFAPERSPAAQADALRSVYQSAVSRTLEGFGNGKPVSIVFAGGEQAEIVPLSTFVNQAGEFCREFETRFPEVPGNRVAVSVACREPQGTWRIDGAYLGGEPASDVLSIGHTLARAKE